MDSTAVPGEGPGPARQRFLDQLREIQEDPEVIRLAQRRAGSLDLTKDALNQAYAAVAERGPAGILDVRAYFCRVLINAAMELCGKFAPSWDFEQAAEKHPDRYVGHAFPRPVDELVCSRLLTAGFLSTFRTQRGELNARVAGRSPDPGRYQAAIVSIAEQVLRAIATGDLSDADANPALAAAYREWFAEPGCATNNRDQRCHRARADVRKLLGTIISRDDLYP